jgi:pyoverdine/dityrosine biosynthesis protein Dit1
MNVYIENHLNNLFNTNVRSKELAEDIVEVLFMIITSTKFRRTSLSNETKDDILCKIIKKVSKNEPIEFSYPFGGVKSWKFKCFPYPNWAELFCLDHLVKFSSRISQIYQPGVEITFSSGDYVMSYANNIPKHYSETYLEYFSKIITFVNLKTPRNLIFSIQRIADMYSDVEIQEELVQNLLKCKNEWRNYSSDYQNNLLKSARNNFLLNGIIDFSAASDLEKSDLWNQSTFKNLAYLSLERRRLFNKRSDRIQIVNINGPTLSIHLGSTSASTVQFWVGEGIVEVRKERTVSQIYSSNQLMSKNLKLNQVQNDLKYLSPPLESIFSYEV